MDARVSFRRPGAIQLEEAPTFRLGTATVDPAAHEVRFDGTVERIQAQPMRVLLALARSAGNPLTREALAEQCWDGRIVGDDVINRTVLILRGVATRSGAFQIETIPRAGYRLMVVERRGWRRMVAIAGGALVLMAIAGWTLLPHAPTAPTVALAPMASHLSGADQAQLPAEIRSALSHALLDVGLAVDADNNMAGRHVGADYLITGELAERGASVLATIQMEDRRHGMLILSRQFERPRAGASALAPEIAASIAANIAAIGPIMALERRHPTSPAVLGNLLNVMYLHGSQGDPFRAYDIARRTAMEAPNSPIAQISLAVSAGFLLGELPERDRPRTLAIGLAAAAAAQRLSPEFGDNHFVWCLLHPHVEFRLCEDQLRLGVKVDPEASTASLSLSVLSLETGQFDQALRTARLSSSAAPYNPIHLDFLIQALEIDGLSEEASRVAARGQRWWPDHKAFNWSRVMGMSERGDLAALERFDRTTPIALIPYDREPVSAALAAAIKGDGPRLRRACVGAGPHGSTRQICMALLVRAGDLDPAFAIADILYPTSWSSSAQERQQLWLQRPEGFPLTFLSSSAAAPMRKDPRFYEVARRSGLIDYWRARRPDFCRTEDCSALLRPGR